MSRPRWPQLDVSYTRVFTSSRADTYFEALERQVVYIQDACITLYGKTFEIPRQIAAYGDVGMSYRFSGLTVYAQPWTPTLSEIKDIVENVSGATFNFVLINRYRNGRDSIASHRDDERGIVPNSTICSVSLGAERPFLFTRRGYETFKILLEHGSLLTMKPPTNEYWYHSLPKCKTDQPRINLTFRKNF